MERAAPCAGRLQVVRGLQERAARALPAEHTEHLDGWVLRRPAGSSWWTGSVLPHRDVAGPVLARLISAAEEFHAADGTPATFQITPGVCPAGLDAALAERDYRRRSPMSLRTAATVDVLARTRSSSPVVRLDQAPTDAWLEVWRSVSASGSAPQVERRVLARVSGPSAYAAAVDRGEVVAVGRAVVDTGWAGVFGMATLPGARRRGAATAVLAALARWADVRGAGSLYLQVAREHGPTARLYDAAGFTRLADYHYRTAPS